MKALPWALLGQRTAFNKDLGTSSSELTLGTHIQVPGSLLQEVTSAEPIISDILKKLQLHNSKLAVPTSTNPQKTVEPPSPNVTHVYAREHNTRGLQNRYRGPLKILDRPTRSSLEIKVGLNSDGSNRSQLRSWADCKPANRREGVEDASRPKRGRPAKNLQPKTVTEQSSSDTSDASTNGGVGTEVQNKSPNPADSNVSGKPVRSTRNPAPNYVETIDFSEPPPGFSAGNSNSLPTSAEPMTTTGPPPFGGFLRRGSWSASGQELEVINRSIGGY